MSIVIGMVAQNCAIVASDGILLSGAYFCNGELTKKSVPINNSFDKIFSLNEGKIMGAFAGSVLFQKKSVAVHISEILSEECNLENTWNEKLNICKIGLKSRLEAVDNSEILFEYRKIDLIFISSDSNNLEDLKIYTVRFKPNDNNTEIILENEIIPTGLKNPRLVYWKLFGDTNSQNYIQQFLNDSIRNLPEINEKNLRPLAYKAIRLGIKHSEKNEFGDYQNCGGKPFVKSIK